MSKSQFWSASLAEPDELMLEAGAGGELLVARFRMVAAVTILLAPLFAWLSGSQWHEILIGLILALIGVISASVILMLVRRGSRKPWLRFVSAAVDVSLVSLALAGFLVAGHPHTAVNSLVVWEIYLLAILATALRCDGRVSVFAGALSIGLYGTIIVVAASFDLNDPTWAPFEYGMFRWSDQLSRLVLMALTTLIAMAVVVRNSKLLHLAGADPLTQLPNRTYFRHRFARELNAREHNQSRMAIAMIDLDEFKHINDTLGHSAGDIALCELAQALQSELRPDDLLARHGGDEFVVLSPDHSADHLAQRLDAVRTALNDDSQHRVTVSIGVAEFPADGHEMQKLLDVADGRLMQAKRWGKNQVVSSG